MQNNHKTVLLTRLLAIIEKEEVDLHCLLQKLIEFTENYTLQSARSVEPLTAKDFIVLYNEHFKYFYKF